MSVASPICLRLLTQLMRWAGLGLGQRGQQERGENRDDGNDHQQFNECKGTFLLSLFRHNKCVGFRLKYCGGVRALSIVVPEKLAEIFHSVRE